MAAASGMEMADCDSADECSLLASASASASAPSLRIEARPEHYQLSWSDHQLHLVEYFDCLLQNERMVDVTLACQETSVRAHRVVVSACR